MSDYIPKKGYKVYAIIDESNPPGTLIHSLHSTDPHTEPFATYVAAENWIILHGNRQVTYTIMETFVKP